MEDVLVTCYKNPDLDGFSCAIAYSEFLNKIGFKTKTLIQGSPTKETIFLMEYFNLDYPTKIENLEDYKKIILTDASDLNALSGLDPQKVIEVIDHRKYYNKKLFPNAKFQVELVGAAATLIVEKFIKNKIELSRRSGILLYGAIFSNTLNFKSNTATIRDKEMSLWLKDKFLMPDDLIEKMFLAKSKLNGKLLKQEMKTEFAIFPEIKTGMVQLEVFNAENIVKNRIKEIISILDIFKKESKVNLIFLSIVDIDKECNYFITNDLNVQKILTKTLKVDFQNNIASRPKLIMRKEIVPLLVKELNV